MLDTEGGKNATVKWRIMDKMTVFFTLVTAKGYRIEKPSWASCIRELFMLQLVMRNFMSGQHTVLQIVFEFLHLLVSSKMEISQELGHPSYAANPQTARIYQVIDENRILSET